MVFGTFDGLHEGHKSFFRQAKKLGGYLTVIVARDNFVEKAKGHLPGRSQKTRVSDIRKTKLADKALLGSRTYNFYQTIRTHKPNLIALGYDQKPAINSLKKDLKKHRLRNIKIVRLRPYKSDIFKSSKLNRGNINY